MALQAALVDARHLAAQLQHTAPRLPGELAPLSNEGVRIPDKARRLLYSHHLVGDLFTAATPLKGLRPGSPCLGTISPLHRWNP